MRTSREIIDTIRQSLPDSSATDLPDIEGMGFDYGPMMLIFSLFFLVMFICAVPACGFFGAKNGHLDLVCLFSGFSGLQGCCGCCSCVMTVPMIIGIGLMMNALKPMLTMCDASEMCPLTEGKVANSAGLVQDLHSIDCLAASVWPYGTYNSGDEYTRAYPDFGEVMGMDCPTILFLNCTYQQAISNPPLPLTSAMSSHSRARSWALKHLHESARSPVSYHVRRLLSRAGRGFASLRSDPYQPAMQPDDMPEDVLNSCLADQKGMEGFHTMRTVLPGIWDSVKGLLWLSNALTIVSAVLSLIGALYGQKLYQALLRQRGDYMATTPQMSTAGVVVVTNVQPAPYSAGAVEMNPTSPRGPAPIELA